MIAILKDEFRKCMMMCGCTSIADICEEMVVERMYAKL
jgi:isopentenyl diphosphate isomerase/L-lactate dehydrogenase-like FMN-dependent dehydrogenase